MACNECNQISTCNDNTNPECSCPLKLGTICVFYDGIPLLNIDAVEGDNLQEILIKIDSLFGDIVNGGLFTNVGSGVGIYKQVNLQGQAEFKTFIDSDSITVSVDGTEEFKAEVDESWLTTYIQNTFDNVNVGGGAEIYKGTNGTDEEFRTLISDTLEITQETDAVRVEFPNNFGSIPRYIVNNLYTGTEQLGTIAKPFKTIQAAIDAFVGTGTANNPQYDFATIIIQKGNTYTFTGNLSYRNLNIVIEEDAFINHSPSAGAYFCDYDTLDNTAAELSIEIREGARINLNQKGFKNIGSTGGSSEPKEIKITGTGTLQFSGTKAAGYALFEANTSNLAGYNMPNFANFAIEDTFVYSVEKDIWNIGRDADLYFKNCVIRHAGVGDVIDTASESFDQTGGYIDLDGCDIFINGVSRVNGFTQTKDPAYQCTMSITNCRLQFPQGITNLFVNKGSSDTPILYCQFFTMTSSNVIAEIFDSPVLWDTVDFRYNVIPFGNIDSTVVDLTKGNTVSVSNLIGGELIESLVQYPTRTAAEAVLMKNSKFINTNTSSGDTGTWFIDITMQ